jgi:hypothetical protein
MTIKPLIRSDIQEQELKVLPCGENGMPCTSDPGVIWGRSVQGTEWAECMACGREFPGYLASDNEQRKLWAKIDARKREQEEKPAAA